MKLELEKKCEESGLFEWIHSSFTIYARSSKMMQDLWMSIPSAVYKYLEHAENSVVPVTYL